MFIYVGVVEVTLCIWGQKVRIWEIFVIKKQSTLKTDCFLIDLSLQ